MYHSLHPRVRPSVCVAELKRHVEQMCYRLEKGPSVHYRVVTPQIVILLNAHEAMLRIRCASACVDCWSRWLLID